MHDRKSRCCEGDSCFWGMLFFAKDSLIDIYLSYKRGFYEKANI